MGAFRDLIHNGNVRKGPRVVTKNLLPFEVPFRLFVAITFAGSIAFHILGLGIHTYIGHKKNALVDQIETLAETRSRLIGFEAGLSVLTERLRSAGMKERIQKEIALRQLFPQMRLMTLLLEKQHIFSLGKNPALKRTLEGAARSLMQCREAVGGPALACLDRAMLAFSEFGRQLARIRSQVSLQLNSVERFQSRLEHWDSILYWLTTIFGLLFMGLGWRNVVLQVGNPIKDAARYFETLRDDQPSRSSSLPALFSIRELRILKENMKNVHRDGLTGLPTRQAIGIILKDEMESAQKSLSPLSIGLLDIDGFRNFNKRYGHGTGDRVLREVARTIEQALRPKECCGRWGEEEFLLVLPGLSLDMARDFLDILRSKIGRPIEIPPETTLKVRASGGVSCFSGDEKFEDLLSRAERALSRVRREGGNGVGAEIS